MRAALAFAVPFLLAACGPRLQGPVTEPHVPPTVEPVEPMEPMEPKEPTAQARAEADDPMLEAGKELFDGVCSACHTLEPPPNLAPPMRMVSMHLHQAFDSREGAVDHVVSYAPAPDAERSILPSHALDRFGLMPPQPLRPDQLEKVAAYVWSLGKDMPLMGGMGVGKGMGMGRQGGMRQGQGTQVRMRHRDGGGS